MSTRVLLLLLIALALSAPYSNRADDLVGDDSDGDDTEDGKTINRKDFPADFIFGAASSAYQVEGAANEDGKGPSTWDTFTEKHPDKVKDHSSGKVADDSYHRYKEDVSMLKDLGFDAYRFSIAWTRILPRGKISGGLNRAGIEYYNNLTNEILSQGMQPVATIFHMDLPQALEDEYRGFLNKTIVSDFADYAWLCFRLFGDRIKHWITINEPFSYSVYGYAYGTFPPNRCSSDKSALNGNNAFFVSRHANSVTSDCKEGNSGTEPYLVSHHLLLAHAAAVKIYRQNFQKSQKGQIGITLNVDWAVPYDNTSEKDHDAAKRALAFMYGWFMDPLHNGAYPNVMVTHVRERLPEFSKSESEMVKGSYDFIGINYYTASYSIDRPCLYGPTGNYLTDSCVNATKVNKDGVPIGQKGASDWLYSYPKGFGEILRYTKDNYNDPLIYVTENGFDGKKSYYVKDWMRKNYHRDHLSALKDAITNDKVNVKGYFLWSILDNFEWLDGYTVRFGIIYVNYDETLDQKTGYLSRTCKNSSYWFKNFLKGDN